VRRLYNEVYRITAVVQFSSVQFSSVQYSLGESQGKFVVEEELEVDL
jgi:hypothetical protein